MKTMGMCVLLLFSATTLSACSLNKWRSPTGALQNSATFVKGVVGTAVVIDTANKAAKTAEAVSDTVKTVDKMQDKSNKNQDNSVNKNQDNPSPKAPE